MGCAGAGTRVGRVDVSVEVAVEGHRARPRGNQADEHREDPSRGERRRAARRARGRGRSRRTAWRRPCARRSRVTRTSARRAMTLTTAHSLADASPRPGATSSAAARFHVRAAGTRSGRRLRRPRGSPRSPAVPPSRCARGRSDRARAPRSRSPSGRARAPSTSGKRSCSSRASASTSSDAFEASESVPSATSRPASRSAEQRRELALDVEVRPRTEDDARPPRRRGAAISSGRASVMWTDSTCGPSAPSASAWAIGPSLGQGNAVERVTASARGASRRSGPSPSSSARRSAACSARWRVVTAPRVPGLLHEVAHDRRVRRVERVGRHDIGEVARSATPRPCAHERPPAPPPPRAEAPPRRRAPRGTRHPPMPRAGERVDGDPSRFDTSPTAAVANASRSSAA